MTGGGWGWRRRHGPTRPMPRSARIVTERLACFVWLRAIVGRRCVPIGGARRHRNEPSSLENSRTQIVSAGGCARVDSRRRWPGLWVGGDSAESRNGSNQGPPDCAKPGCGLTRRPSSSDVSAESLPQTGQPARRHIGNHGSGRDQRRPASRSPHNATVPLTSACGASHGTKWPQSRRRNGPTWSGNTTAAMRSNSG